ncbi:hypothetical protein [Helicobacter sp. 11S02629-2]|uniref:hypothetical protein n=1 Tax=Helicobacter sp. 11S02629-2 TaxID=1476195 RepID=UPI000BA63904|nr:hypothetical protein [Helicobacter sp. 11S02629-2]PAF44147.1 hypothetical protein BKH40_06005 [Helicobacter sp. 11S02629-2]
MSNLSFEQQLIIAATQAIIAKHDVVVKDEVVASLLNLELDTLKNKRCQGDKDIPKYAQLKGKRVFMASDIAEFMVKSKKF